MRITKLDINNAVNVSMFANVTHICHYGRHTNTNVTKTCNHRLSANSCGSIIGEPYRKSFGFISLSQSNGNYTRNDIIN